MEIIWLIYNFLAIVRFLFVKKGNQITVHRKSLLTMLTEYQWQCFQQ